PGLIVRPRDTIYGVPFATVRYARAHAVALLPLLNAQPWLTASLHHGEPVDPTYCNPSATPCGDRLDLPKTRSWPATCRRRRTRGSRCRNCAGRWAGCVTIWTLCWPGCPRTARPTCQKGCPGPTDGCRPMSISDRRKEVMSKLLTRKAAARRGASAPGSPG